MGKLKHRKKWNVPKINYPYNTCNLSFLEKGMFKEERGNEDRNNGRAVSWVGGPEVGK